MDSLTATLTAPWPVLDTSTTFRTVDSLVVPATVEELFAPLWPETATLPSNVTLHVDPRIRPEWARDQTATIDLSFAVNAKLGYAPTIPTDIWVGQDYSYLGPHLTYGWCGQIKGDSDPLFGGGGECGNGTIFARLAAWSNFSGGEVYPYPSSAFDLWLNGNLPHEIGHNAQNEAARRAGNPDYWRTYPAWLREGWANVMKIAIWGRARGLTYRQAREPFFQSIGQHCRDVRLQDVVANHPDRCEYETGVFGTEYLLAAFQRIQAPFWMPQRAHASDFNAAFKATYGVDFSVFAAAADRYIADQYSIHFP